MQWHYVQKTIRQTLINKFDVITTYKRCYCFKNIAISTSESVLVLITSSLPRVIKCINLKSQRLTYWCSKLICNLLKCYELLILLNFKENIMVSLKHLYIHNGRNLEKMNIAKNIKKNKNCCIVKKETSNGARCNKI